MPQQSLLPDHPAMTSLHIEVRTYPMTSAPGLVSLWVRVGCGTAPPKVRSVHTLTGIEVDYLDTFVESVTTTFMYGETPKDVVRSATDVCRLAREHRRSAEF